MKNTLNTFFSNKANIVKVLLAFYYLVGFLGLTHPLTAELFKSLIPFTILASTFILLLYHPAWHKWHIAAFAVIALLGYWIEVAGVATGIIFGDYEYLYALGFEILKTPPIIGLNWLMLIYAVFSLLEPLKWPALAKIFAGSLLMVGYDIILEPVAMALNMWTWEGEIVPIQNYMAWFFISFLFLFIMHRSKVVAKNPIGGYLFVLQFAFFLALNIFFSFHG
ncbi:MAG TPA: carotenoid biosynthesis protein [Bacteroidales bacterium]|nr:carotenoid biosynthesis protein [Bacteroidales bacterium]